MGGCQNYGPFLGILRTQTGTLILTTTHINSLRNQGMGYRVFKQSTVVWGCTVLRGAYKALMKVSRSCGSALNPKP